MNGSPAIDVLIAEDNDVFRAALELTLGAEPDIRVVASVADGLSAAAACEEACPEVVLMDYRLPGLDGVEATASIRSACPATAVVALTASAETEEVEALYRSGAAACLTKESDVNEIVAAIRDAARGTATVV
jgi:DNA-binding NarL/FixJ family response regulator